MDSAPKFVNGTDEYGRPHWNCQSLMITLGMKAARPNETDA